MFHPFYPWTFPDAAFPFAVLDVPGHGNLPLHRHRFMEIVYIVAGQGTHVLDGDVSTIAAGDCFVIPVESAHGYTDVAALHLVNILFDPQLLAPFLPELHALPGYHALCTLEPRWRTQHDTRGRLRPSA
ncbi:MAG TPA: AraC family ligand binding domain-containing protein, partial [Armatimonadota bacterium]